MYLKLKAHLKRNWFWYLIITLLVAGNLYFYSGKKLAVYHGERMLDDEQIACTEKIANIVEQNEIEQLKNQGTFYAAFLSPDLVNKDYSDARDKMDLIVKNTFITQLEYVSSDGEIQLASIKSREGSNGKKELPGNLFSTGRSIPVHSTELGHVASVPIYKEETQVGRLLIYHSKSTSNIAPK